MIPPADPLRVLRPAIACPMEKWRSVAREFHGVQECLTKGLLQSDFEPSDLARLRKGQGFGAAHRGVIPLLDLLASQGLVIDRRGKSYKARCPFHKAKGPEKPSLLVWPMAGSGAADRAGSVGTGWIS